MLVLKELLNLKFDWRNIVIHIIIMCISVMAFFTLIDWFIEKDNIVGVGNVVSFFGSVFGGIISGGLTLAGVFLGFKLERKKSLIERYHSVSSELIDFEDWLDTNESIVKFLLNAKGEEVNLDTKELKEEGREYEVIATKLDNELFSFLKEYNYNLAWFYLNLEMLKSNK